MVEEFLRLRRRFDAEDKNFIASALRLADYQSALQNQQIKDAGEIHDYQGNREATLLVRR